MMVPVTEFLRILKTRRSIRCYKPDPIPQELIFELLDLCRYAANAHNAQPFRFIVLLNKSIKRQLIEAMCNRYASDLKSDGLPEEKIQQFVDLSKHRFLEAPALILACLTMQDMDKYSDNARQQCEYLMAVQSVANALHNLLLIAHAKGLGANWYCAPLFCPDLIKSILNLPDSYIPQAFITLGIPNETPPRLKRKPIEHLVQIIE